MFIWPLTAALIYWCMRNADKTNTTHNIQKDNINLMKSSHFVCFKSRLWAIEFLSSQVLCCFVCFDVCLFCFVVVVFLGNHLPESFLLGSLIPVQLLQGQDKRQLAQGHLCAWPCIVRGHAVHGGAVQQCCILWASQWQPLWSGMGIGRGSVDFRWKKKMSAPQK